MQELVTTESIPKKSPTTLILCHHIHPAAVTIHTKYKCNKSSRVQWSYKASNSLHSSKPWGGGRGFFTCEKLFTVFPKPFPISGNFLGLKLRVSTPPAITANSGTPRLNTPAHTNTMFAPLYCCLLKLSRSCYKHPFTFFTEA